MYCKRKEIIWLKTNLNIYNRSYIIGSRIIDLKCRITKNREITFYL